MTDTPTKLVKPDVSIDKATITIRNQDTWEEFQKRVAGLDVWITQSIIRFEGIAGGRVTDE